MEKIDPRAAATGALIALGLDATLGSTAWRTGGGGGGGFSILNGASDPTAGVGADGDFFINTSAWTIFGPKAAGAWPAGVSLVGPQGEEGAQGDPGSDGVDGATILAGSGAPSSGAGSDGDVYIDTAARALYGPKSAGAWGAGVSLAGADGADGSDGADGTEIELQVTATHVQWRQVGGAWADLVALASITGPAGSDGSDGSDGADGSDGMDGTTLAGIVTVSGTTYTPVLGDAGKMLEFTNAAGCAVTIPPNGSVGYPIGTVIHFAQDAAGQVTFIPGSGVTFKVNAAFVLGTAGQHSVVSAAKVATNTWRIFGDMELA